MPWASTRQTPPPVRPRQIKHRKVENAGLFNTTGPVVLDGAMGSMLLSMGRATSRGPHLACLTAPEAVSSIHADYAAVGARVSTTNTFLLGKEGEGEASVILERAIRLARPHGPVWLSLGPAAPAPNQAPSWWPLTAKADAILFETWSGPDLESWLAFQPTVPLVLCFCLQSGGIKSLGGWGPARMAEMAHRHGAMAVGINCGWDGQSDAYPRAVEALRRATMLPIVARPASCGLGPRSWSAMAVECVRAGATHVGGCCGTTPEHIRLLVADLGGPPIARQRKAQGLS